MPGSTDLERFDAVVVGAGAAGLMTAIQARRRNPERSLLVLDGAPRLGAKILISGGGRCNVTHDTVDASAFAGSTPAAIRRILSRFGVSETLAFFRELGVTLVREDTGKLFPDTDRARTVLDALLGEAGRRGAIVRHPQRVERVERDRAFRISGGWGTVAADRLVLATGGMSVPKTGSDGHGYRLAEALGHTITPRLLPALVPLTLPAAHPLTTLSGVSLPAVLRVRGGGLRVTLGGSTLFTHFGLSGPAVLDASRHFLHAVAEDPDTRVTASWLPDAAEEVVNAALRDLGPRTVFAFLRERLPERLARVLCAEAGIDTALKGGALSRETRRSLLELLFRYPLPIAGSRGFAVAEATAGGVPLAEVHLDTMESRRTPGLHLVGEILDVDGRIGGYNFQWAWSSGFVAGAALGAPG